MVDNMSNIAIFTKNVSTVCTFLPRRRIHYCTAHKYQRQ